MPKRTIKHVRQTPGLCGPASLRSLLSHFGKNFSEGELAKLCRATSEDGTDHDDMAGGVRALGFEPVVKSEASFEDLRSFVDLDVPVIVGWWSADGDHFSVVYDIEGDTIWMMDPEIDEGPRSMKIEDFMPIWFDKDGPENLVVERWMMAIPSLGK
ncbi:MAG: cysteine peptidase family C39 domain-containing protein [Patescibacteria group bacterium]